MSKRTISNVEKLAIRFMDDIPHKYKTSKEIIQYCQDQVLQSQVLESSTTTAHAVRQGQWYCVIEHEISKGSNKTKSQANKEFKRLFPTTNIRTIQRRKKLAKYVSQASPLVNVDQDRLHKVVTLVKDDQTIEDFLGHAGIPLPGPKIDLATMTKFIGEIDDLINSRKVQKAEKDESGSSHPETRNLLHDKKYQKTVKAIKQIYEDFQVDGSVEPFKDLAAHEKDRLFDLFADAERKFRQLKSTFASDSVETEPGLRCLEDVV